jgi:hypothetical protein
MREFGANSIPSFFGSLTEISYADNMITFLLQIVVTYGILFQLLLFPLVSIYYCNGSNVLLSYEVARVASLVISS